jgi:hypothetical protein
MRDAAFPPVRVESKIRADIDAVLRKGEPLTQFGEAAVVAAPAWRRVEPEFVNRGEAAIERWKHEGSGHSVDAVMDDLQARLDDAKRRAAQRERRWRSSTRQHCDKRRCKPASPRSIGAGPLSPRAAASRPR